MNLTLDAIRAVVREELDRRLGDAPPPEPEVMTRSQVAELLQVEEHTVTKWVKKRKLPGVSLGREWRFRRAEVLAWMKEQAR